MHAEASECRERGLKTLAECRRVEQMEELIAAELIWPPAARAAECRLKQELQEQAAHDLDLFFGHARAFAQEHEERIALIQYAFEVGHLVSAEHQPEVFGQEERLESRDDRVLGSSGDTRVGAPEKFFHREVLRLFYQEPAEQF